VKLLWSELSSYPTRNGRPRGGPGTSPDGPFVALKSPPVRVPLAEGTLAAVPEDVSPEEALLLGDVFSTGYFCAQQARVEPGCICAIVGCGPVGLMAVVGARELGADRIFALDSIPERLDLAAGYGATPIDFKSTDPVAVVREATEGRGADAALDAVGTSASTRAAYDLVRATVGTTYSDIPKAARSILDGIRNAVTKHAKEEGIEFLNLHNPVFYLHYHQNLHCHPLLRYHHRHHYPRILHRLLHRHSLRLHRRHRARNHSDGNSCRLLNNRFLFP